MNYEWAKLFKWKFTIFSVHPTLIFQKHFLTHFNLVRHLVTSIMIRALVFLCRTNVSTGSLMFICSHWYCSCKQGIKRFFAGRCSLSFTLVPTNLYLTSVGKLGSQLSIRKNEEKYVEVCLVTLCANKTPSII